MNQQHATAAEAAKKAVEEMRAAGEISPKDADKLIDEIASGRLNPDALKTMIEGDFALAIKIAEKTLSQLPPALRGPIREHIFDPWKERMQTYSTALSDIAGDLIGKIVEPVDPGASPGDDSSPPQADR